MRVWRVLGIFLGHSLLCAGLARASLFEEIKQLPDAPGKDLLLTHCSACHSLQIISQNRMTRPQWDATITWMQRTQNLWAFEPKVRASILDYLATHFGPPQEAEHQRQDYRPVNPLPEHVFF